MCGIAGYFCWGGARPSALAVKHLLAAQEPRGPDAAGVAYVDDGGVVVNKAPGKPTAFIKEQPDSWWETVTKSHVALLHARAKTKGSEKDNNNNHPVYWGDWTVTHNGTIANDDDIFKHYGVTRFAEVDTAAIPAVLSQGKNYLDSLHHLTLLGGSGTMAILNAKDTSQVALYRFGKWELYFVYDPLKRIVYWSSLPGGIDLLPGTKIGSLWFTNLSRLVEDRLVVFSPSDKGAKADTWQLERSPFLAPRSPALPMRTPNGGGSTATTAAEPRKEKWKWSRPANPLNAGKPSPAINELASVDCKHWDLDMIRYALHANNMTPQERDKLERDGKMYPTAHGRWFIRPIPVKDYNLSLTTQESLLMLFRPRKGFKRWMAKVCADRKIYSPSLPANAEMKAAVDDLLEMEPFDMEIPFGESSYHSKSCYMCPWCGVIAFWWDWDKGEKGGCRFCGIRSRKPSANHS